MSFISIKIYIALKNLPQGFLLARKQMIECKQITGETENFKS